MTAVAGSPALSGAAAGAPRVHIVVPVFNEERALPFSVRRLHAFLTAELPFTWRIVIADNASTDGTATVARRLAEELPGVEVRHLPAKGRGRALRAAWSASPAEVLCYMDVDLSTDLRALLPLVAPLLSGHSDLAIGTRLARGARVQRGPKRELISRAYNALLHAALGARFSDAQCGFKAVRSEVARALLPAVRDDGWFFDTELLVVAQRRGLRVHEVPVDWVDDADSRVDIVRTASADLAGVARLLVQRPVVRFLLIGVLSATGRAARRPRARVGGARRRQRDRRGRPVRPAAPAARAAGGPASRDRASVVAEVALPAEEHVEPEAGQEQPAHAQDHEGAERGDVAHEPAEVLAEEARDEGQRQEDRGEDRQLLHDGVHAVGHRRHVQVGDRGHPVALAVELVGDAQEVVVEVAEVVVGSGIEAGEVGELVKGTRGEVALGHDGPPQ